MTDDAALSASERQALELLPWYVNGTLEGDEREQVRRELRSSLTCRLEYERLSRMQSLMQGDDAEQAATDRGFERLMARIHADGRSRPAAARRFTQWLPLAQAATVLVLVGSAAWWWSEGAPNRAETYQTLTTEPPAMAQGTELRLVFKAGVAEEERRALFAELGLRMVGAPTVDGVYTVALPSDASAREFFNRLGTDPRVALVTTPPEVSGP
jgi:hypothetical protein